LNYFEDHIGDYAAATAHLSWDEDMAYTRLIRSYYHSERPIPQSQAYRLARASTPSQRRAVDTVLAEFFTLLEDGYHQKRCDAEIARFQDKQRKARASADARWSKPQSQSERNANASPDSMRSHSEGNAPSLQSPDTRHQEPGKEKKPPAAPWLTVSDLTADGLTAETGEAFLAHRRAKKAKLTALAWDGFKAEVVKAGWTCEAAALKAIARNWTAFEAAWVLDRPGAAAPVLDTAATRAASTAEARRLLGFNTGEVIDA
jgi:uncharacterized protein YdaU (DUF1376 family)